MLRTVIRTSIPTAGALTLALALALAAGCGERGGKEGPAEAAEAAGKDYGAGVEPVDDPTPIPSIVKKPADFDGETVVVRGVIASVCPSAGCFLHLGEGAAQIKVDMNPKGFHVEPGRGAGQVAWAAGEVVVAGGEAVIIATGVRIMEKN